MSTFNPYRYIPPTVTDNQRAAINRIKSRCSIRGAILYGDGTIQVGFESASGRDREAVIAPNGARLETRDTYGH